MIDDSNFYSPSRTSILFKAPLFLYSHLFPFLNRMSPSPDFVLAFFLLDLHHLRWAHETNPEVEISEPNTLSHAKFIICCFCSFSYQTPSIGDFLFLQKQYFDYFCSTDFSTCITMPFTRTTTASTDNTAVWLWWRLGSSRRYCVLLLLFTSVYMKCWGFGDSYEQFSMALLIIRPTSTDGQPSYIL